VKCVAAIHARGENPFRSATRSPYSTR
jgi:hypothetical protein